MKDQLLKLCRRLSKFSLEQIVLISELEETQVLPILKEFVSEGKLLGSEGQYCYCRQVSTMQKHSIFSYYNSMIIDTIIRCFCSGVPAYIAAQIASISEGQALKFYEIFRIELYEKQTKQLKTFYAHKPQIARNRIFFDTELHFYIYKKQVFVSDIVYYSEKAQSFTKNEYKEFKKIYCYLTRCAFHNKTKYNLPQKLNEFLWRRNKDFEQLYFELKQLLNISS